MTGKKRITKFKNRNNLCQKFDCSKQNKSVWDWIKRELAKLDLSIDSTMSELNMRLIEDLQR